MTQFKVLFWHMPGKRIIQDRPIGLCLRNFTFWLSLVIIKASEIQPAQYCLAEVRPVFQT
jgi:hypothetical protein